MLKPQDRENTDDQSATRELGKELLAAESALTSIKLKRLRNRGMRGRGGEKPFDQMLPEGAVRPRAQSETK